MSSCPFSRGKINPDLATKNQLTSMAKELGVALPYFRQRYIRAVTQMENAINQALKDTENLGIEQSEIQHVIKTLIKYFF